MKLLRVAVGMAVFLLSSSLLAAPRAWTETLAVADAEVPGLILARVDRAKLQAEDEAHVAAAVGAATTKRLRIARGDEVAVTTADHGVWQATADGGRLWRLRIGAPDATELQIGFTGFDLPEGATVSVYSLSERYSTDAYSRADANQFGQLWSAFVPGDAAIVELYLPPGAGPHVLKIGYVGSGYRDMFQREGGFVTLGSGMCNINVACPLGDPYRDEIRSVAHYTFVDSGTWICTGTLVANATGDRRPLFLTAAHCVASNTVAGTMRFYWNYQSSTCSGNTGVSMAQSQLGAQLRMTRANVDTTLVQLNAEPPQAFNVFYSGWDATGATPGGTIGIHHPSGDAKKITEDANGVTTMNNCIGSGTSTHWRIGAPYTQGTTEGGSSGSGIWIPAGDATGGQKLVIGVLSGGNADCAGSVPNSGYDCYGKLSVAYDGAAANQRLKDWLDPQTSGATRVQGYNATNDTIFKHGFE